MAANYWESRWAQCVTSKERLLQTQLDDRVRGLTEYQIQKIKVHFIASISDLVKQYRLAFKVDLRQRVAATASVYFRRFYLKNCFCYVDPRLVFVGCIYLASKVEESQLQAKHLVTFMRKYRPMWNYDMKHLLDMEMILMEDLNFNLVVFSPYRSLALFLRDMGTTEQVGLRAWTILNDSYRTDVSLMHPPHMVALACIHMAVALVGVECNATVKTQDVQQQQQQQQKQKQQQQGLGKVAGMPQGGSSSSQEGCAGSLQTEQCVERLVEWMATLNVDLNQVYEIVLDLTTMYEHHITPISVEECGRLLDAVQGLQGPTQGMAVPGAMKR